MDQKKYRKLFLEEARAHLTALDSEIVALEGATAPAAVDSLFRHAHSIKGMAASMGYEPVVEISHALEDLLDDMRENQVEINASVIDRLLEAADALEEMVQAVEDETEFADYTGLVKRLRAGKTPLQPAEPARPGADPELPVTPGGEILLMLTFATDIPLPAARAFQAARLLEPLATAFQPTLEQLRAGKFDGLLQVYFNAQPPSELLDKVRTTPGLKDASFQAAAAEVTAEKTNGKKEQRLEVPSQIRINTSVLDRFIDMVGELLTVNNQLRETSRGLFSEELQTGVDALSRITGDLYQEVLQARMVQFSLLAERLPRIVRDLSQQLGKQVKFNVTGGDVELDRSIMDALSDPLLHLVRNGIDHGIEPPSQRTAAGKPPFGRMDVKAYQAEGLVFIHISDDGRGIDAQKVRTKAVQRKLLSEAAAEALSEGEVFDLLFRPGFSTAEQVSDVSGRGVGLDVVKSVIENVGGEIRLESTFGEGSRFELRLPARVAIMPIFLIRAGEEQFAIPIAKVSRARWIQRSEIQRIGSRETVILEDTAYAYYNLAHMLGVPESFEENHEITVFLLERGTHQALIGVDGLLGEQEVYLKAAPAPLDRLRGVLGITLIGGRPVFVLDPSMIVWNYV